MNMRGSIYALFGLTVLAGGLVPAGAAEIKIMAPRGIWTVLQEAGPAFERATGHKINFSVDLATAMSKASPELTRRVTTAARSTLTLIL